MSKNSKKIQKNIKNNVVKKKEEYKEKNQIINLVKIIAIILITVTIITATATIIQKNYKLDNEEETSITNEILAGQTFNRSEEEYYVAFYDFNSDESLESTISNIENTKIYKVDLSNAMNKQIIGETSNKKAESSDELKIKETTLIQIKNGKISNYIEGYENITNYLNELK